MSDIKKLVNSNILFTQSSHVQQVCSALEKYGIHGFIYMRHFDDGSFIDLSNQPKWSENFIKSFLNERYNSSEITDHMFVEDNISLWKLNPENII